MSQEQFSGLMYALKAIEKQFIDDHMKNLMKDAEETLNIEKFIETYDPTKPAMNPNGTKRKKLNSKNTKEPTS